MKLHRVLLHTVIITALAVCSASATTFVSTYQGETYDDLPLAISDSDVIQGNIGTLLEGGWHPANGDPADQLAAFTDGIGMRPSGLTGLLRDFPGDGVPALSVQYDLDVAADIAEIRVFSGNHYDGRTFHTYTVEWSDNGGFTWSNPIYVQSHPSGTINSSSAAAPFKRTLTRLQDVSGTLAMGVTNLRFNLYSTSNTQGWMWDPFTGVNPFTGVDDGFGAAFESPLIHEIDVMLVPEPASMLVLASGLLGLGAIRRKKS